MSAENIDSWSYRQQSPTGAVDDRRKFLMETFAEVRDTKFGIHNFPDGKVVGIATRIAICLIIGKDGYKLAKKFIRLCFMPLRFAVMNVQLEVLRGGTVLHAICGDRPIFADVDNESMDLHVGLAVNMWCFMRENGATIKLNDDGYRPWEVSVKDSPEMDRFLQSNICEKIADFESDHGPERFSMSPPFVEQFVTICPYECTEKYGEWLGFLDTTDYETYEPYEYDSREPYEYESEEPPVDKRGIMVSQMMRRLGPMQLAT
jgi:hypothetical protein